ncbi:hypothetical protein BWP39_22485 [Paraburkholderia acidicola]|uniref:Cation efflux protein transmembrane domain-containing protein n=1 Tax=Paraburkholderia acidicola TaxID=1912599 RepID=A0A2A4EPU7_9BURK|nr:cation diffusion facilitator family transporter [Paraburkholderia acidicola]PCE22448.1 hypothetical protein BWP39_22485 [Paraburkholderia acidicola]
MTTPLQERTSSTSATSKVLVASIVLNLLLMALQVTVGLSAHSSGMLADALHSFVDMLADALVLLACALDARAAAADPTRRYPKYEPLALLALGALLGATGLQMVWQSWESAVRSGVNPDSHFDIVTLGVAVLALASKETLFRWMAREAKRSRSTLLLANAWHVRADALSSLVVTVAIGGSLAGLTRLDDLAAALIGLMIVKTGYSFGSRGLRDLKQRRHTTAQRPAATAPARMHVVRTDALTMPLDARVLPLQPSHDRTPTRLIPVDQDAPVLESRSAA